VIDRGAEVFPPRLAELGNDVNDFIVILISLPLVGALIGYVCKWLAIKMLFYPSKFVGIGPLGWQGVVQRRAPKFAAGVAETVASTGISVGGLLERLDPKTVAELSGPMLDALAPDLVRSVIEEIKPGAFAQMPAEVRSGLVAQLNQQGRTLVASLTAALKPVIVEVIDVQRVVVAQLSGRNADRLARLFQRVGRRELQVVIYYGAVLGFLIGLLEVGGYAALEKWWLLPIIGAVDGLVNNWLAIQMIFRPLERKRYLGVFPFQGLFPARQAEIASEYSVMLAEEVLGPRDVALHIDAVGIARLKRAALDTIAREAGPLMQALSMMLGTPVTEESRTRILDNLSARVIAALPAYLPTIEAKLKEQLAVATTIERQLAVMPKQEFERVLRGVFEEDEWILVSLGGVLGGAIGLLQGGIVLWLQ
jgi:uncharacterized membrane protein YheB (UPF0754 family)